MIDWLLDYARLNYNLLVVLAGVSLLGASSGVIGAFAVLRRRALTGDALAHAALPGLCVAFLIVLERNLLAMLGGALASGIIGIMIIAALGRWTRVKSDAAIGIVLSVSFGLGIVLLRIIQDMEGVGSKAGLRSYIFGKTAGMVLDDVYVILAAAILCLAAIVLLYKEFKAVSFDTDFARSLGWPVYGIDLLLMSLVAAAVVIGLPNVGVILISALLIMPGAAARFWTDRLSTLLVLAGALGFATGLVGTLLSARYAQLPAGAVIVLTGAALFGGSLLFGWRRGAIARLVQHLRFRRQWNERQLLAAVYDLYEQRGTFSRPLRLGDLAAQRSWTAGQVDSLVRTAAADGLARTSAAGEVELTSAGWQRAVEVARGQRLWRAFLDAYPDQAGSTLDLARLSPAEILPAEVVEELTGRLRDAGRWPEEGGPR